MGERLTNRSEIIYALLDKVQYAAALKIEKDQTPDDENDDGEPIDPIHAYCDAVVYDTMPVAILAIALMLGEFIDLGVI